jgi:copper chaperone NosL
MTMSRMATSHGPEAAPSGAVIRNWAVRHFLGEFPRGQRLLVGLVGFALLPVMFLPILPLWKIFLVAPQYREGLSLLIFTNDVRGDLDRINILNHYIGMQRIDAATFPEFGYLPWVLSAFGLIALLAAVVGRRWLAFLGWAGFATFGTVMMGHFAGWMTEFGTNLDPKAALDFGAFTPPLLGTAVRGNFTVTSLPHIGGYILFLAGALGPFLVAVDLWKHRHEAPIPRPKGSTVAPAAAILLILGLLVTPARADEFTSYAKPPRASPLQARLESAGPGDTIQIPDGVYPGQLVVDRTVVLVGGPGAILDGEGKSSVVVLKAPG